MLDRWLRPWVERPLQTLARPLATRVSANTVTLLGFSIGLIALPTLISQQYLWALGLILLNRILDGLDGTLARIQGPSERGAYLDIVCDMLFYASTTLGFGLANPDHLLPAAVLLACFMGTSATFLTFAIFAAKHDWTPPKNTKGLYYLGGLTEGSETIAFFGLACLFPGQFPLLAGTFATACFFTTIGRMGQAWQKLR